MAQKAFFKVVVKSLCLKFKKGDLRYGLRCNKKKARAVFRTFSNLIFLINTCSILA